MVLTYNEDGERPEKDWVLKTDHGLDGDSLSYLDMMERNSQEDRRRVRERQLMEEGKALWQQKHQEEMDLASRDMEEIKELSRGKMFGRPGHGAPTGDIRKKKFTEHQLDNGTLRRSQSMFSIEDAGFGNAPLGHGTQYTSDMDLDGDVMTFGRDGAGAPMRTNSGRLRSTLRGNPEIRFQANEGVQKSIYNQIRYAAPHDEKSSYHSDLEKQVMQKKTDGCIGEKHRPHNQQTSGECRGSSMGKTWPWRSILEGFCYYWPRVL